MFRFVLFVLLACVFSISASASSVSVLKKTDVEVYKEIFELQRKNYLTSARKKQSQLSNKLLMGYILYNRYFSNRYKTTQKEISDWMERYSDLPVAGEMYALGQQKKVKKLKRPKGIFGSNTNACVKPFRQDPIDLIVEMDFSDIKDENEKQSLIKIKDNFLSSLKANELEKAYLIVSQEDVCQRISQLNCDKMKVALAFSYILSGDDNFAMTLADDAADLSASKVPLSLWVAGLAHWRKGDFKKSSSYFSNLADLSEADEFLRVKAAYWAARSYLACGSYEETLQYLYKASEFPRYFYGMLAMSALGRDLNYVWANPSKPTDEIVGSFSHPALKRFYALRQIGQREWATQELSKLYLEADDEAKGILMMISEKNGFADVLQNLTGTLQGEEARYPMPDWRPQGGWKLDKALVYAFVRQESCFNKRAESYVGALGLMQLMPDTAKALAGSLQCPYSKRSLKDPAYNLRLGQAYLLQLLGYPQVQNNLIFLAAAYNAGPGNLNKWKKNVKYQEDSLLFLEIMPSKETRGFVERILVNYWIYRHLMGLPLDSLDEIVQGEWPMYREE